jgi:putative membrane protein
LTEYERWPRWVYASGADPDYRFSFANERTFLAWIRTSLGLLAGGVALDAVPLDIPRGLQVGLATALLVLGMLCALASWIRWARSERAMRTGARLPGFGFSAVLVAAVVLIAAAILTFWL